MEVNHKQLKINILSLKFDFKKLRESYAKWTPTTVRIN